MGLVKWYRDKKQKKHQSEVQGDRNTLEGKDGDSAVNPAPDRVDAPERISSLPKELLWLIDAPLFIDERQVNALYDATVRPDYEDVQITISNAISKDTSIGGSISVNGGMPWLTAGGGLTRDKSKGVNRSRDTSAAAVSNPYRHLIAVTLHYAGEPEYRNRLLRGDLGVPVVLDGLDQRIPAWTEEAFIDSLPRALALIELPPRSIIIPAALELVDAEVHVIADELAEKLGEKSGESPMAWPSSDAPQEQRTKYYSWFRSNWDDRIAIKTVEDTVKDHQIAWIDYNTLVVAESKGVEVPLHLHVSGRGVYDTGVFAYNFITRAYNYGIRVVGTLKSGPDLNVLAIFER